MQAIFQIQGKQIQASQDEIIKVLHVSGEAGDKIKSAEVLSIIDGDNISIGQPFLKNAFVECKILEVKKAKKKRVFKYKSKVNYHVASGHRDTEATLQVVSIKS